MTREMAIAAVYWSLAAVAWALSAWLIFSTVVEVIRGKSRPLSADAIVGVFFHGGLAVLALWLAYMARHGV